MHAVVRRYTGQGGSQLFAELEARTDEVRRIIGDVPGLVSYTLVRTGEGGCSVTVCQDKAGADESSRRAAEWVRQNVAAAAGSPPEIAEGTVLLQIGGTAGMAGMQPAAGEAAQPQANA